MSKWGFIVLWLQLFCRFEFFKKLKVGENVDKDPVARTMLIVRTITLTYLLGHSFLQAKAELLVANFRQDTVRWDNLPKVAKNYEVH